MDYFVSADIMEHPHRTRMHISDEPYTEQVVLTEGQGIWYFKPESPEGQCTHNKGTLLSWFYFKHNEYVCSGVEESKYGQAGVTFQELHSVILCFARWLVHFPPSTECLQDPPTLWYCHCTNSRLPCEHSPYGNGWSSTAMDRHIQRKTSQKHHRRRQDRKWFGLPLLNLCFPTMCCWFCIIIGML